MVRGTKLIDRVKEDDDDREFECRLAARDFKPRRESMDDLFAMPPLCAVCFRCRGARNETGTRSGRSEAHVLRRERSAAHVHRREESALQREM